MPLMTLFRAWRAQVRAALTCDKDAVTRTLRANDGVVCRRCWLRQDCRACCLVVARQSLFDESEQKSALQLDRCRFCHTVCIFCSASALTHSCPDLALMHALLSVVYEDLAPLDECSGLGAEQLLALHRVVSFNPIRAVSHARECVAERRYEPLLDATRALKRFAQEYHRPGGAWHLRHMQDDGIDALLRADDAAESLREDWH